MSDAPDLYATYGSSPDEPLSEHITLASARRAAKVFAANGGRPIRIVRYTAAEEVETVEPEPS